MAARTRPAPLGQQLRHVRIERGLSYRGAADLLHVSHTQVRRWEQGNEAPTEDRLADVAAFLGVDLAAVRAAWEAHHDDAGHRRVEATTPARLLRLEEEVTELGGRLDAANSRIAVLTNLIESMVERIDNAPASAAKPQRSN